MLKYFDIIILAIVLSLLIVPSVLADDTCCGNGNGSEVISPAQAFLVVDKQLSKLDVERGEQFPVTINLTNYGQNPACSIEIIDYLDDNFDLTPGTVEIPLNSFLGCHYDDQYANPNRIVFKCDWLKEYGSGVNEKNSILIKFNLTVNDDVNATRNLSEFNHVNTVNVTGYYGSYSNNQISCTFGKDGAEPIGTLETPHEGEPGAAARRGNMTDSENFTVIPKSKITVVKDASSGIAEVGDKINYTLYITNLGVYNVTINNTYDVLPYGFENVSKVTLPFIIKPGETVNRSYEVVVTSDAREGQNINYVNVSGVTTTGKKVSGTSSAMVFVMGKSAIPYLSIEKSLVTQEGVKKIGETWQNAQYKVVVRNVGNGKAYNVTVTDNLPSPDWKILSVLSYACDDGSIVTFDGNTSFKISGFISSGASCIFEYNVEIPDGEDPGMYVNTAGVSGFNGYGERIKPWVVEDSAYTFLEIAGWGSALIQVRKTADNVNPEPGDIVNFTISMCSLFNENITSVHIMDYLPKGFDFINATNNSDIQLVGVVGQKVTWFTNTIAPGSQNCKQLFITTLVNSNVSAGVNANIVTAEGNVSNGTAYGSANLLLNVRKPQIAVRKDVLGNVLVVPGNNVTYKIEIQNLGDATVHNVTMDDYLPVGWEHVGQPYDIEPSWCNVVRINSTFYINTSLIPLAECSFKYKVYVSPGTGDGQYYNTIKAYGRDGSGGVVSPTVDTAAVFIRGFAALEVIKKLSTDQIEFEPGDTVGFNISISNRGHGTITSIDIEDILPVGFKFDHLVCPNSVTCIPTVKDGVVSTSFNYILNPDDIIVVQLFANVTSDAISGALPNKVIVTAFRSDGGILLDKDIAMAVVKKPYLTIDKWTPTPTRTSGTSVTYLIRVRNIGTGTAKNITLEDNVPGGFAFTNSTESPKRLSGACSDVVLLSHNATNTSYTFGILGNLSGSDECVFQYVVNIGQNVSDGTYPNVATLRAKDASDSDLPEQTVTAYVFVVAGVAVDVKKTADKGIAAPGDHVNFTITISNKGDSPAEVSIVDTMPYGFYTNDQTSWASQTIPSKSTIVKNIVATVNTTAPEFNLNRVDVSGSGPLGSYSIDDIAIVIVKKPHVSISKVALTENTYSGGDVGYAINVLNDGGANAHDIYMVDNLPGNFTYNMDVGNCGSYNVGVNPNSPTNQITFNISDFAPGKCTFYFSAHVPNGTSDGLYGNTLSGFYTDVAGGNYTIPANTMAYVSVRSAEEALKIFIDKTTNQSYLEIGDHVSFTLTVTNPSITPIGNVYIQDIMPPGFIVDSCSISDNSTMNEDKCSGSEVTYHGLMPPGEIIVPINATVTSSAIEYTTFNKATAYALNTDGTIGLKSEDIVLLVVGKPHLDVIKESVDATAIPGEIVKYHVIVKNTGTGTAKNVTITDHLQQAEWNIIGIDASSGCGNVTYSNNKFTINNSGKFSPDAYCEFYYDVKIPSNESDGNYVNYVEVTGQDLLGAPLMKDKDEAYQSVLSHPGLFVKKRANATSYLHGDIVQYTINVTNTGNSNLTDVVIKDSSPEGFIFNSISGAILNNNCSDPENNIYCFNLTGNIEQKSTKTVILTANATQNATEGININTVDVYATSADGSIIEQSAIALISLKRPHVTYSKVALTENRYPGENASYLITVRNEGTSASTVNIVDNLPGGFTYNNDVTKCADFPVNATVIGNNIIIFEINNFSQGECSFLYSLHISDNASSGIYGNKLSGNYTNDNGINYALNNITTAKVYVIKSEGGKLFLGKYVDKTSADVSEVVRFTINITNPWLTSINNVLVHDTLPDGFVVVACNSTRTELKQQQCSGNTVRFNGTLSPGTSLITIDAIVTSNAYEFLNINTVTVKGETISGTPLNENAIAYLNVKKPHLYIEKRVEENYTYVKGSTVEYHIRVVNKGTGNATNITIKDSKAFDPLWGIGPVTTINCGGITITKCNNGLTSCSSSESSPEIFALGNPAELGFGTLPPGAECHFAYNLTIPNIQPGLYENSATVYGKDNYGTDLQTDTDEAYIQVVKTGILLRKEMNATIAQPGDYITSKIYLTNIGPTTVNNLIINDTLPLGWAYVAGSAAIDGVQFSCSQDGKNLVCSPFTISPYESTTVEFSLYVTNNTGDGINTNHVKVSWEDNNGNYYSSNASASLTVEKPKLNLVKSVDVRYVEPGAKPMFTLIVQNPTYAKITNLNLTDYMPISFTYVYGTTQLDGLNYSDPVVVGNYNTTGENLTWYLGDIEPKTIKVLTFIARVKCNVTDGNFTNNASVSGSGKDGSLISADTYIHMSGHKANATLYKFASKQIVKPFDLVNYTIVIFNPSDSANILPLTLVDKLPRGMRYIPGSGYVGDLPRNPNISGSYSNGYTLTWNMSDHFMTVGTQLTIKYTVIISYFLDPIATNQAVLSYLDPPNPTSVDDHLFETNATNTIGCKDCYGGDFNISSEPTNYTLHLHEGWNLISIPIQPYNTSLKSVLAPINSKYDAVVTFTTDWLYHIQNGNSWVTTLNNIEPGRGYWINMKQEANLTIYGNTITNATVPLHEGWNLVGMPVDHSLNIDQLTIEGKWTDIYTFTTTWTYISYSHGSYFGNLDTMNPGRGYWINMVEPGELIFVP